MNEKLYDVSLGGIYDQSLLKISCMVNLWSNSACVTTILD